MISCQSLTIKQVLVATFKVAVAQQICQEEEQCIMKRLTVMVTLYANAIVVYSQVDDHPPPSCQV